MIFESTLAIRHHVLTLLLVCLAGANFTAPLAWTYQTGNYAWTAVVSGDGQWILAGSDDMHSYFFKTDSDIPSWVHSSSGYVRHATMSRDGSYSATGDSAGDVLLFQLQDGGRPAWRYHSDSPISALAMSQEGDYLVAGDRQGGLYVFSTASSDPLWQTRVSGGILAISVSESLNLVAAGAHGGLHFFGNIPSHLQLVWSFQNYTSFPYVGTIGEAECVVAGASDGGMYVITPSGQLLTREHVAGAVSALSVADDLPFIAVGSTSGTVAIFELETELLEKDVIETSGPVTAVAVSSRGERASFASLNGTIGMYEHSLTRKLWSFNVDAVVHSLSMSRNGRVMVAASDTGCIYVFNENNISESDLTPIIPIVFLLCAVSAMVVVIAWRRASRLKAR